MASAPEIEIGKPFPELALPSMDSGKPMSIAAFRGKKVILQVFASW
jgi:peroxiredoxin